MPTRQQSISVRLEPVAERHLAELISFYNETNITDITTSDAVRHALAYTHRRLVQGHRDTEPTT